MKILELFCGTKSISKVFGLGGWETFTVDMDEQFKPDICKDVAVLNVEDLPVEWRKPDIVWASPPCDCFSVASIGTHWHKDKTPKTIKAQNAIFLLEQVCALISVLDPKFYFIETPRGMMRNFLRQDHRKTVTYGFFLVGTHQAFL